MRSLQNSQLDLRHFMPEFWARRTHRIGHGRTRTNESPDCRGDDSMSHGRLPTASKHDLHAFEWSMFPIFPGTEGIASLNWRKCFSRNIDARRISSMQCVRNRAVLVVHLGIPYPGPRITSGIFVDEKLFGARRRCHCEVHRALVSAAP